MARLIEFYVPSDFKPKIRSLNEKQRGELITFPVRFDTETQFQEGLVVPTNRNEWRNSKPILAQLLCMLISIA
jgi:hypothetical protein